MKKIYLITASVFYAFIINTYQAQDSEFNYYVQYNLIDVDFTGEDTLFSAECMLGLNISDSDIASVEINIGTAQGLTDVKQLTIPYNHGTQMSLFNGNNKAMIHLGNLSPVVYFYQVRLIYQDGTTTLYKEQHSLVN